MDSTPYSVRIAPRPAAVAEVCDFMHDIFAQNFVADCGNKWQGVGLNEKINAVSGDSKTVLVDDVVLCSAKHGITRPSFVVTTIKNFRRYIFCLFRRKPLESVL